MSRRARGHLPTGPMIEHSAELTVRFHEIDSLGIAWHGHYLAWFEVGREAMGQAFGLAYADFLAAQVAAPIVHVCADYVEPARHGDLLRVRTRLYGCAAARIELTYDVRRAADDRPLARGHSTQVFVKPDGGMMLNLPPLIRAFYERHLPHVLEKA